MFNIFIYIICGLFSGFCLGTTSFNPVSIVLLILDALKIGNYKSNLGSIMLLNVFPVSIGPTYNFYKKKLINYPLAITLIITITLGSYLGSLLVTRKNSSLTDKQIKYFTGIISLIFGIIFLISAYYSEDKK
jgi:uncharacterized membrane protein YfcA